MNGTAGQRAKDAGEVTRREVFSPASLLGAVAGGAALAVISLGADKRAFAQRPPGALPEKKFISRCAKCGQCIRACPFDAVLMAEPGSGAAPGTPYIVSRIVPCYMCEDIPCARACPSGALDHNLTDIRKARMGIAVLADRETCVALQGLRCEVCYMVCPALGKAITIKTWINERTGAHTIFEPVVDSGHCTGCGKCEHACILDKPAIRVMSIDSVKGAIGGHYRFGWKEEDI